MAAIDDFNDEPADRAVQALRACNAAPRFAAEVAAGRPYRDVETLVSRAEDVARALPWDEVAIALAAHPRIGDRVQGSSAEAAASRREQGSMGGADDDTRAAIVEGNRAYEERFGHVYLVCATGRSAQQLLDVLRARLGNDPATERAVALGELAAINRLRIARMFSEDAP